jgi:hypothetical protein
VRLAEARRREVLASILRTIFFRCEDILEENLIKLILVDPMRRKNYVLRITILPKATGFRILEQESTDLAVA